MRSQFQYIIIMVHELLLFTLIQILLVLVLGF